MVWVSNMALLRSGTKTVKSETDVSTPRARRATVYLYMLITAVTIIIACVLYGLYNLPPPPVWEGPPTPPVWEGPPTPPPSTYRVPLDTVKNTPDVLAYSWVLFQIFPKPGNAFKLLGSML